MLNFIIAVIGLAAWFSLCWIVYTDTFRRNKRG